jgi:hypothetical protein
MHEAVSNALAARQMQWSDAETGGLGRAINLASPEEAKGLEFEAVVVVDPEDIVRETEHGMRMLYIALTRTTKYLTVLHTGVALPIPGTSAVSDSDEGTDPEARATSAALQETATPPEGSDPGASPHQAVVGKDSGSLAERIAQVVAAELADHIRTNTSRESWPRVIDLIRRDLDISDESLFDQFGD